MADTLTTGCSPYRMALRGYAVVDPDLEIFDQSRTGLSLEQFQRLFAVQCCGRPAQPSVGLFLAAKRLFSLGSYPGDTFCVH
jgi:hypothetical protein